MSNLLRAEFLAPHPLAPSTKATIFDPSAYVLPGNANPFALAPRAQEGRVTRHRNGAQGNKVPSGAPQPARGPGLGQGDELQCGRPGSTYLLQDGGGQFVRQLLLVVPQVTGLILLVLRREGREGAHAVGGSGDPAITFLGVLTTEAEGGWVRP